MTDGLADRTKTLEKTRQQLENDERWSKLSVSMRQHVLAATTEVILLKDDEVRRRVIERTPPRDVPRLVGALLLFGEKVRDQYLVHWDKDDPNVQMQLRGQLAIAETRAAFGLAQPPNQDLAAVTDNADTMAELFQAGRLAHDAVLALTATEA